MTDKNIILRKAEEKDIDKIHEWWTNGSIMSAVGFPKGLTINKSEVYQAVKKKSRY